ncbi:BON domain-containing protein [Streptomyces sp. WAC05858]|nr:BON domain-containing protein [Streptomyces sp. AgN23]RSS40560.1 BON domain-containing protein [Streptomyces sp. WAC05858]
MWPNTPAWSWPAPDSAGPGSSICRWASNCPGSAERHGLRVVGVVSEADLLPKEEFRDSDPDRFEQLRRLPYLLPGSSVHVRVREGVVTLGGQLRDTSLVPVAVRLARAVEGAVEVECHFRASDRTRRSARSEGDSSGTRGRYYGSMSSTSWTGRLGVRVPGGPYPSRSTICT